MKAKIGEIWLVTIPILDYDKDDNVNIKLQKRPCLIIDDGRGLVVEEDNRNLFLELRYLLKLNNNN